MAPIKFEENIKDKLEQRTIQPSSEGWQKLSERLDAAPKRKSKGYWWLGIAASFVGLLIVSSILFSKGDGDAINTPVIVNEDPKNAADDAVKNPVIEEEKIQEIEITSEEFKELDTILKKELIPTNHVITQSTEKKILLVKENVSKEEIVSVVTPQENVIATSIEGTKTHEDLKVDEVVGQILKLQKEKSSVTDAEIDALLKQAEKELMTQRLYNASTLTVDADVLLSQVETDLEQSFRDRVFDALKSGYKKVKTAVAERNN